MGNYGTWFGFLITDSGGNFLFHHIQSWPALDLTKQVKPKNESLEQKDPNTTQLNVNETDLGKFTMIRTEEENRLIIVAQMRSSISFFFLSFNIVRNRNI